MQPPDRDDDLVIPTPERVTFQYPTAGLGSRFLAQALDLLVLSTIYTVLIIAALAIAAGDPRLQELLAILIGFVVIFGYFLTSEGLMTGQTLGKRAVGLRVVGDHGEPITFMQSVIRNLIRLVDFLPVGYGVGIVALFINGRGKRLGDLAAGTVVVRERQRVSLYDLAGSAPSTPAVEPPPTSIWAPPPSPVAEPSIWASESIPSATAGPSMAPAGGHSDGETPGPIDAPLRKLVVAYAARREQLPLDRRRAVAGSAEPALRRVLPATVATAGPLVALDRLAELEGLPPERRMYGQATTALVMGILSIATAIVIFIIPLFGLACGITAIIVGSQAGRAIRSAPHRWLGAERARTGLVLGIIGTAISSLVVVVIVLLIVFGHS